jgi:hypothetical protein
MAWLWVVLGVIGVAALTLIVLFIRLVIRDASQP